MRPLLWLFVAKLWARRRSLRWIPHSIHQVHNTSTAHRRQFRNRGHFHRRCEVDDVEGCLPFERRQQTEIHRHVESLPAACWMPHRTRGGGCRPVDCGNSHNTTIYEYTCNIRVYLQVQQWLVACNMKETDWGWMTKDENVVPVMTFLPPAPDELFRVFRCNCTTTMMMMTDSQMQLSQAQSGVFPCKRSVPRYRMFQQHRGWYKWRRRRRWWWWQIVRLELVRYLIPTIFIDTWIWFDTRYSILDTFVVNLPKTYKPIVQPSRWSC